MSDIAVSNERPAPVPSGRQRIAPKLAKALSLMVDEAMPIHKAAQAAGMTTYAVRLAFEKPHVLQFVRKRKQMLRESISLANITRLAEIRDAANNMPAVNAIKLLEEMGEDRSGAPGDGAASSPGVTINIINGIAPASGQHTGGFPVTAQPLTIDAVPLAPPSGRNRP